MGITAGAGIMIMLVFRIVEYGYLWETTEGYSPIRYLEKPEIIDCIKSRYHNCSFLSDLSFRYI